MSNATAITEPISNPRPLAKKLLGVLDKDLPKLKRIDDYLEGNHDDPYMPAQADDEYRLLARRSVSNWMTLLVKTPAQALYVDDFRRGAGINPDEEDGTTTSAEWKHWQRSRLDARQIAIHEGALAYGHSFALTEKTKKGVITKGLSPLRTAAVYEDPANDDTPYAALTIVRQPTPDMPGKARMWDSRNEYTVTFKSIDDLDSVAIQGRPKRHGASECPVTRFAAAVDLEGRTTGVIWPMIALQNRINQTVFDLLVAQTYGSFKVRTVTGMAPPMEMEPEYEVEGDKTTPIIGYRPKLDADGKPIPAKINHNARRFLFAEDKDVTFDSLDETPLGGFIESIDMSIRHLSAITQTPPHHLLGQIANLSAEALQAAETALSRKIEQFKKLFGECWERVFRVAGELAGDTASAEDFESEVKWRDMEGRSLAQAADGLGKLAEQLGIPRRALWKRVPGSTAGEWRYWRQVQEEDDFDLQMSQSLRRASDPNPTFLEPAGV